MGYFTPSSPGASDSSAFSHSSARSSFTRSRSARPHSLAQSSAPPTGQGCGEDPPPRLVGPASSHFPSRGFSFLKCLVSGGLGCLYQNPQLVLTRPSPRPSFASPPSGPSARTAQSARRRPGTILSLSGAPASRVFCSLRLRLFSWAEPRPCSSWVAPQPRSPF